MPISGPTVHQQLLDAYANVQGYLESEREAILDAQDQRDELRGDRGDALDSLAEHYLPELTQEAIRQTWSEVREGMTQILRRKQDHARRAELELTELNKRRNQLDQELIEVNQQFDHARAAQDEIAAKVERQLREDSRFVELSDRAAIAEVALERAEANLQEIDQESSRKLPAFDESSLFRYLYDRGYGTDKYKHRGFTRRMDRWLARYIDFVSARQSYDFLLRTPDKMRQIIAEDRKALDTVMLELEKRRDRAAEANGLPAAMDQTRVVSDRRDKHLASIDSLLAKINDKNTELSDVDDARGIYYREAIEAFRELLNQHDVSELRNRAEQTEEITDDQIVARLMGVDVAIDKLDAVASQQRSRLDEIQSFLDGLGRVIQRFRAAQFDSARSNFLNSLDIDEEVARVHEQGDVDALWKCIRRSQRWGDIEDEAEPAPATNPMQQILTNAMSRAAEDEHSEPARRAGDRRAQQQSTRR